MQSEPERELISSSLESFESFVLLSRDVTALDREISSFTTFLTNGCIVNNNNNNIYFYSYVIRFWSQIVAFFFLQFINVWISVMMVLFHNTECGNKGNKLKSWLLLLSFFFFPSDCIGLAYEAVTWWTNDSNPKTRNRWTNSVPNLNRMLRMRNWTNHSQRRLVLPESH